MDTRSCKYVQKYIDACIHNRTIRTMCLKTCGHACYNEGVEILTGLMFLVALSDRSADTLFEIYT